MPSPATPRERIVAAAAKLFLERSYTAVGIAEICAAADVRKGTLYHFFGSKADVGKAVLDSHEAQFDRQFNRAAEAQDPLRALLGVVTAVQTGLEAYFGRILGCPMGNLAAELATVDDDLRRHLADIFTRWENRLHQGCTQAAAQGALRPGVDPAQMARAILAQIEGLILLAKVQNRPAADIVAGLEDMLTLYLADERVVS